MVLSPNLQHGVRRQTFKEYASLDFGLDDIPIHFVAEVGMRREHDSLYLGLAPVTTFSFPPVVNPALFHVLCRAWKFEIVCLALRRRPVAVVLSMAFSAGTAPSPLSLE